MKINEIVEKIDSSKVILSTMPRNNIKNNRDYENKIDELLEEYKEYQKDIATKLKKKYQAETKLESNADEENLEQRIKSIKCILDILDEYKTSYEKMELDKSIFKISKYYKDNLENVNNEIKLCINKFADVGIFLSQNDFCYSKYASKYMKVFFQEIHKENINSVKLKATFEKLYWKCPELIKHIELNLRYLYLQNQKAIDKHFETERNEILQKLDGNSNDTIRNYYELKKELIEKKETNKSILKEQFLSGKLNAKNYTLEKMNSDLQKVLDKEMCEKINDSEELQNNINKFLYSLYEYRNYMDFSFIVDDVKKHYAQKADYKNIYDNTKKDIEKLEKKLFTLNKKGEKKFSLFGAKKDGFKQANEIKELIQSISDKYKELDKNKFYNKIYQELTDESTLYDALKLANSYYTYLVDCIIENFKDIPQNEIEQQTYKLNEFLNSPYNVLIKNFNIMEETDIQLVIKDRYKLLNFKVEKDDLNIAGIDTYISKLENIKMMINLKKANLQIPEIEDLCEIKKLLKL